MLPHSAVVLVCTSVVAEISASQMLEQEHYSSHKALLALLCSLAQAQLSKKDVPDLPSQERAQLIQVAMSWCLVSSDRRLAGSRGILSPSVAVDGHSALCTLVGLLLHCRRQPHTVTRLHDNVPL